MQFYRTCRLPNPPIHLHQLIQRGFSNRTVSEDTGYAKKNKTTKKKNSDKTWLPNSKENIFDSSFLDLCNAFQYKSAWVA